MAGDASSYTALGLEPGADAPAVERAYKRLIKQHHPDREGGDARRAAEINRAYRDLKGAQAYRDPLELNQPVEAERRRGRAWVLASLLIAAAVASLFIADGPLGWIGAPQPLRSGHVRPSAVGDPMDRPLDFAAIADAVGEARSIARSQDEIALSRASRDCHRELRNQPSLARLDRCAAFDDAVVLLQDRDPLRDRGPFSEISVTGRLWSAASALSDDYLAIDSRLDRIRLQVELALAPPDPPAIVPTSQSQRLPPRP